MDTGSLRWYTRIRLTRVFRPIYLVLGLVLSLSACQNSCCGCGGPTPGTISGNLALASMNSSQCTYVPSASQHLHIEVQGDRKWAKKTYDYLGSLTNSYSIEVPDGCSVGITVTVTDPAHPCLECTATSRCERFTGFAQTKSNGVANKTYTVEVEWVDCNC